MTPQFLWIFVAPVLFTSAFYAHAEEAPLITERPGFSTSPQALPQGKIQVEAGVDFDLDVEGVTLPVSLMRYGVAKKLEVQVGWGGISFVPGDDGVNDLIVNAKYALSPQQGNRPNIGIIIGTTIPLDDGRGLSDTQTTVGALWSYDYADGIGLFGTATLVTQNVADDRDWALTNAVGVAKALPEDFGTFIELFSRFDDKAGDAHILDFGLTYLFQPELQLDVSAGVGLAGRSAFDFVSFGVSTRW
ncbi:MAG: transporter [Pseudomonadota bacterium]